VIVPDLEGLARAAAKHVRAAAARAIARRGRFRLALAGGSTPRVLYRALAADAGGIDWRRTDFFFGDERAVPPDHAASNYHMVRETLLEPAGIPAANVHRLRGDDADLDATARAYEETLKAGAAPPWLDLALLGLGPDGHTASLFPRAPGLHERERLAIAAEAGLEPFVPRVTMTPPMLANADCVLFLITGEAKADAVRQGFEEPPSDATPTSRIRSRDGQTIVVLDAAAASKLARSI
jgi:6-phosphogluconolactonase